VLDVKRRPLLDIRNLMHNAHVSMPSNNLRRKIPKWSEIINRGSMSVSLSKNQSVSLSKQAPNGLSAITLGVGWDVAKPGILWQGFWRWQRQH
jgi:hypothetical protein